jgi:hypothetical protein
MHRFRRHGKDIHDDAEPTALLAGFGSHVTDGLPEAKCLVPDGEYGEAPRSFFGQVLPSQSTSTGSDHCSRGDVAESTVRQIVVPRLRDRPAGDSRRATPDVAGEPAKVVDNPATVDAIGDAANICCPGNAFIHSAMPIPAAAARRSCRRAPVDLSAAKPVASLVPYSS